MPRDLWPGSDMTRHDLSYNKGNAVCVHLSSPHSYAPLAFADAHSSCHQPQYPRCLVLLLSWAID